MLIYLRYDLAEKVNSRLDEMGKDLSSMIEEINDSSSILNKNNKPDDPVIQCSAFTCRVLTVGLAFSSRQNSQFTSLSASTNRSRLCCLAA